MLTTFRCCRTCHAPPQPSTHCRIFGSTWQPRQLSSPWGPDLIADRIDLFLPDLPSALEGLRIAHLTDLHFTRISNRPATITQALSHLKLDLVFITGDIQSWYAKPEPALEMFDQLARDLAPRHGVFAVFGNHDSAHLRDEIPSRAENVRWLCNEATRHVDLPLDLLGLDNPGDGPPDIAAAVASMSTLGMLDEPIDQAMPEQTRPNATRCRLALCHKPRYLPVLADLGFSIMFSGHTHGGQIRLPARMTIVNSSPLPRHLSSGVLRHLNTMGVVSRGLGEVGIPFRLFCPRQLPVYTLHRGPMLGSPTPHIVNVWPW